MHRFTIDRVLTDKRLSGPSLAMVRAGRHGALRSRVPSALRSLMLSVWCSMRLQAAAIPRLRRVRELWCIVGRRAGKSKMAAALSVYFACFVKHKLVGRGAGMVLTISPTTDSSKVVFNYIFGLHAEVASAAQRNRQHDTQRDQAQERHHDRYACQFVSLA